MSVLLRIVDKVEKVIFARWQRDTVGFRAPAIRVPLALRNLSRNKGHTTIALSAVCFGVIALIIAGGFIEWILWTMRESTIYSRLGHVQVVKSGYLGEGSANPFAYVLDDQSSVLAAIEQGPHVQVVSPRVVFSGLIGRGETSISFIGEGVDPEREKVLNRYVLISDGHDLEKSDPVGILLGAGLAANLGANIGDEVVLLAGTASGGVNAVEARVRGVFRTSTKAFDDSALRMPIALAKELLRVSGAHIWVLALDETRYTDDVIRWLETQLSSHSNELQFIHWKSLAEFYSKTVTLFSRQVRIIWVVIALIIVMSISNVLVMSVLNRISEIGTLMAIGFSRKKIMLQFIAEGAMLGLIGGIVGVVLGTVLAKLISAIGIPMPPPPGMEVGFTGEIRLTQSLVVSALLLSIVTTLLASLYPAWRASRLTIVDALRHAK